MLSQSLYYKSRYRFLKRDHYLHCSTYSYYLELATLCAKWYQRELQFKFTNPTILITFTEKERKLGERENARVIENSIVWKHLPPYLHSTFESSH